MNEQTVLFDLLKEGVSPAHVVKSCEKRLEDAGFEKIAYEKEWNLKAGGRYYVDHHDTTLFAFTIPEDEMKKEEKPAVRIAAAHTDFPAVECRGIRWSDLKYLVRQTAWCGRTCGSEGQ